MILGAKSAGHEGLELGLNIDNIRQLGAFSGTIHIENMKTALDYLESQKRLPLQRKQLANIESLNDIDINFQYKKDLTFNIKNQANNIDIKGYTRFSEGTYSGELLSNPRLIQSVENASIINRIQGTFKGSLKDGRPEKNLTGNITANLDNAPLSFGAIPFRIKDGAVKIDNLSTLSGPLTKDIECQLTAITVKNTCSLSVQIKDGQPSLSDLQISGNGFRLTAPQAPPTDKKTRITLDKIDIQKIAKLLGTPKWNGTGKLSGTMTLEQKNSAPTINLHLKNTGAGTLKLTDSKLFNLMNMEALEKETMILALENFHYDLLEIKATGSLPDNIKISIFGKGKNPALMEGRAFSLDFEIKPNLKSLLTKVTQ